MTETIREQILAIRDTGLTNMFDIPMVQRLAFDRDFQTRDLVWRSTAKSTFTSSCTAKSKPCRQESRMALLVV